VVADTLWHGKAWEISLPLPRHHRPLLLVLLLLVLLLLCLMVNLI